MRPVVSALFLTLFQVAAASTVVSGNSSTADLPLVWSMQDAVYAVNISVGTPAQTIQVALDTEQGDIRLSMPPFDPSKSSTAVNISSDSGLSFTDVIRLGDSVVSAAPYFVSKQESSNGDTLAGYLGLAFAGTADSTNTPVWQQALGNTSEFGLWLGRIDPNTQTGKGPGGTLTFGGVNTSLFSGDIEYLDLTGPSEDFWSLNFSGYSVRGAQKSPMFQSAIFSTGLSYIMGPLADVNAFWEAVPGAKNVTPVPGCNGCFQYPCNTQLNVTVSFGGRSWPIRDFDMNLGPLDSVYCLGAVQGYEGTLDLRDRSITDTWEIGGTFLTNIYSAFRQTPPSLGFAELSTLAGGTGVPNATATGSTSSSGAASSTSPGPTSPPSSQTSIRPSVSTSTVTAPNGSKHATNTRLIGAVVGSVLGLLLFGIL